MERRDSLVQIVSELMEIDSARITSDLPLVGKGMQGSLARTRLDAAIRKRIGIRSPAVYSAKSFGELETAIFTDSTRPQPPSVVTFHSDQPDISSPPISCGIDIENVDDLPGTKDYREDDFYKLAFSPTEIAYCLLQENPRMHFAARWCAKEALRKCDAAYLDVEMSAIEMVNPGSGAPYLAERLNGKAVRLPFAVSVSHTRSAVVAIVIKAASQLVSPVSEGHMTEAETPRGDSPPEQASRAGSGLSLLVFSAIVLAVWALIRTFL
jgi:phosphopantetheine--protein transferase-like protein